MALQQARWIVLLLDRQQAWVVAAKESLLPIGLIIHHLIEIRPTRRRLLSQFLLEPSYHSLGLVLNLLTGSLPCRCGNDVPMSIAKSICYRGRILLRHCLDQAAKLDNVETCCDIVHCPRDMLQDRVRESLGLVTLEVVDWHDTRSNICIDTNTMQGIHSFAMPVIERCKILQCDADTYTLSPLQKRGDRVGRCFPAAQTHGVDQEELWAEGFCGENKSTPAWIHCGLHSHICGEKAFDRVCGTSANLD